jgi:hypothetical protein
MGRRKARKVRSDKMEKQNKRWQKDREVKEKRSKKGEIRVKKKEHEPEGQMLIEIKADDAGCHMFYLNGR